MSLDSFDLADTINNSGHQKLDGDSGLIDHVVTIWGKAISGSGTTSDYVEVARESLLGTSLVIGGALLLKGKGSSAFQSLYKRASLANEQSKMFRAIGDSENAEAALQDYGRLLGQSVVVKTFPNLSETEAGELIDKLQLVPPSNVVVEAASLSGAQKRVILSSSKLATESDQSSRAFWFNDRAEGYKSIGRYDLALADLNKSISLASSKGLISFSSLQRRADLLKVLSKK